MPGMLINEATGAALPLSEGLTLGRAPDNRVVLADNAASSHHAAVHSGPSGWFVQDLQATNGTWLNGQRVEGSAWLKEGDRLQVGSTVFRIAGLTPSPAPLPPPAPVALPPPPPAPPPVPVLAPKCPRCHRDTTPGAAFCAACGQPLAAGVPPLPPAYPTAPYPTSPAPLPAAPRKKRGCFWSCCLGTLILLLLLALGGWWAWNRFFGPKVDELLRTAVAFRQEARFDAPAAFARHATPKARAKVRELDELLWPTVNSGLGWAYFFETSLTVEGERSEGHLPVLFYNPWGDVALLTVWSEDKKLADLEVIAGDCLRRDGRPPFGGLRPWAEAGGYPAVAVGRFTAQSLRAFEAAYRGGSGITTNLGSVHAALRTPEAREASRVACGLQMAQVIQDLVAFADPEVSPLRGAYLSVLALGSEGRIGEALRAAEATPPESRSALEALPRSAWPAFTFTGSVEGGGKVLLLGHHKERPDLFLAAVFRQGDGTLEPDRLDLLSFQSAYRNLK